jgi:serine protease Do
MLLLRSAALVIALLAPGLLYSNSQKSDEVNTSEAHPRQLGYLGLAASPLPEELAQELGAEGATGALIHFVQEGSPAAKAGIQPNDVIVAVNGKTLAEAHELETLVSQLPPGRKIHLKIIRKGQPVRLTAILGGRPAPISGEPSTIIDLPSSEFVFPDMPTPALRWRSAVLGLEYESIDSQLAEFFGVKQGVLVRFVQPGSIAQQGGVRAGDILLKVDGKFVNGPREFALSLQNHRFLRDDLSLEIMRDHKKQSLTLAHGESGRPGSKPPRVLSGNEPSRE